MVDLDALEKAHAESTAGEWSYRWSTDGGIPHIDIETGPHNNDIAGIHNAERPQDDANAAAIVAAHNALPALIAEVRDLRATLANERGEGSPPAPHWHRNTTGEGLWQRVLAGTDDEPTDVILISGSMDGLAWDAVRWVGGGSTVIAESKPARECMRIADREVGNAAFQVGEPSLIPVVADALDAAFLAGAKAMQERASEAFATSDIPGVPLVLFGDAIRVRIRAIDPQTLMRPE